MTALTVTSCRLVRGSDEVLLTAPMGQAGTAGMYFRLNTTTGHLELGNGTTAGELGAVAGLLIDAEPLVGLTGTIVLINSDAIVDLGEALVGLAFDLPIYVSDTDGVLSDGAGDSTVDRIIGRVVPGWAGATADKLLMLKGS
jgi:hypothetical protein